MTSVGPLWGGGPHANPPTSFVLNPSNPNYQTAIATFEGEQFFKNTNFSGYDWPHFRIIRTDDININAFGYGLYKFSVDGGSAYFFIDYRDDNYGRNIYSNCPGNDCNDIWIKCESDPVDKLYYVRHDPDSEPGIDPEHSAWISISNGQLLYYYKIKLQQSPSTDEFPDYWDNCLVLINDGNNIPRIVWGSYEDDDYTTSGYYVSRATNYSFTPPPLNHFSLVATLNSTTYNWTDSSFVIGGVLKAHYYAEAIITPVEGGSSTTSSPTNIVTSTVSSIGGGIGHKDNIKNPALIFSYSLDQNHPNPFNPNTVISYSIKDAGLVTLKVFDILGTELTILVNSTKEEGNHQVKFDASTLPSGIYIYTLQVNGFTDSKKMILLR